MESGPLNQALESYEDLVQALLEKKRVSQREAFLETDKEIWNQPPSLKDCPTPQDLKRWMSWKLTVSFILNVMVKREARADLDS
jgi:hypothetical protein